MSRPAIEIVGGGLAGLALGRALCRAGVPVTLFEAGPLPRHRVCGEFITGLDPQTVEHLQLASPLARATPRREVAWYGRAGAPLRWTLPEPALTLSRHTLDHALAQGFLAAGGDLRLRRRVDPEETPAGRVFASGRRPAPRSPWIGLKVHARGLPLAADLELHLGRRAYVGLARVEGERVNLCGLFHRGNAPSGRPHEVLRRHLQAAGLETLAGRLAEAEICEDSFSAVAGLAWTAPPSGSARLALGDAFAVTPPFTGNGMAMALQSAAGALPFLLAWSQGEVSWEETRRQVHRALHRRFRRRLRHARHVHLWLLSPAATRLAGFLHRRGWVPWRLFYRLVH